MKLSSAKGSANGVHVAVPTHINTDETDLEDDGSESEEVDESLIENILDTAELEPYLPEGKLITF